MPERGIGFACEDASHCLRYDPDIMPTEFVEKNLVRIGPNDLDAFEGKILSINTHGSDETAGIVEKIIDAEYPCFSHEVSFPQSVNITPVGVSKGTGIDYLREHMFACKTFFAVGDNENDIEMLDRADVGFSMGNGADALKRRADVVLPDRLHPCVREIMEWIKRGDCPLS